MNSSDRQLSGREINILIKHGMWPINLQKIGQKPIEYVVGKAEFLDKEFEVSKNTLIPRIETEELVYEVLKDCLELFDPQKDLTIADVGTGSGCIGISLFIKLLEHDFVPKMILSDLSEPALKVAKKNLLKLITPVNQTKFTLLQSDLLLDYPDSIAPDVIVANLPYIPRENLKKLDSSVKDFEPSSALDGGKFKGLTLVLELMVQLQKLPKRPKLIAFEVDEFVKFEDLPDISGFQKSVRQDSFQKNRFVVFLGKV